ncbi:XRE family transcriptional regulator [Salmonella enterica subsp. enterica serovar Gatow]|nr:XRE family transcriptional regulator [Salmonella enterica subsp. enterica serovar Gatow]
MKTISERIKHILVTEGLKQKELALALNASPQTVNNWIKRDSISREAAQQLHEKFGYSIDWLLTGRGNAKQLKRNDGLPPLSEWGTVDTWDRNTPLPKDEVEVPFLKDIEFAAGNGSCTNEDYNGFKLRFSKATLRRIGARTDGSGVLCFPARGNSMEPVIPDGATVAINCDDKRIVDGKVYAINQDGWKRLKLLYRTGPDKLSIRSFNSEEHPPEEVELSNVEVIGRMFWSATLW